MKPDVDLVLRTLATKLLSEIAPALDDAYVRSNLEVAAALLIVAAEDYDRAAHVRAEENRAIRSLFRKAAPGVDHPGLRERLVAEADGEDASLRVGDLDRSNSRLRALLIDLHTFAEARSDDWGRTTCDAILRELAAGAERRTIGFYPL
jgi:hypothetical protein